ncbi:MAG: hypothetical protein K9G48_08570 [Reyranella sp.]|nr:hypothetical protein [Reyranella sp.]
MSGDTIAARIAEIHAEHGTTMTLKRKGLADLIVKGGANGSSDDETGNTAAQSQRTIRISNGEIALQADTRAPKRGDKINVDGRDLVILHVDTKQHAGVTVAHVITAVG